MSAGTYNLVIDQGSDFALDLIIKQSGSALNLTNYSGRAQLRTSVTASSASASFTVTKTNAAGGALKLELSASTSSSLAAGQYVYDLEIFTSGDAIVKRILQGDVTITPEVTR
ncbi:MAG: hypothetical protein CBB96_07665 [Gammaproteobacteria bacterium TMED36]|jgi:hypothetical protein|nr:MAG: hypothetical protein CBB96_07665 [Gammaproteobacteria bacterium TMED36]|tara:strand:+ start:1199 stop:1537 length:339 start_codon:yes stop_codon:yes gene_type:complete